MLHCILVKYKDTIDDARKQTLIPEIKRLFDGLLTMDGIHNVELLPNIIDRPNRYDLLIRIRMDEEVLPVYDVCEVHKRWKAEYGELLEKKAIFDYEG